MGIAPTGSSVRLATSFPNPIDPAGEWIAVLPGAVVHNAGNPVGEAVWWNTVAIDEDQTGIFISCFVPGDGV
jgi:hypothetical protein